MTTQLAAIRPSWCALLALMLLSFAGMAQTAEPVVDSNRKADSAAPVASSKSARKEPASSAPKRAKQPTRGEQSPVSPAARRATNAPIAAPGATGKHDQVQEVPCFKTRLCE
ncbi:MAG: hypothetical protein NTY05_13855 [Rhodocyclales bacterium]|nr:hypothetical protein [Rhodocyclales bacterium]